ncbi:MAG: TIR domain-containing protein [Campylobacter sp.]|nr:TIR domain-containing protein [Campylobacter sp.]
MRKVFFSFHYENDNWRVQQIKNMGVVEGQNICNSNDWEKVKRAGDSAIKKWIDDNMYGCSCIIVLIGSETSNRKWVNYEIKEAWNSGKAIFGIYIHNLKDKNNNTDTKGRNPFDNFTLQSNNEKLSNYVEVYEPNRYNAYNDISKNLENWIEHAMEHKQN